MKYSFLSVLFVYFLCGNPILLKGQNSWTKDLPGIGTFSSPRVADLNGDGIGDIILGAGRKEFEACDSAIIALNGLNGKLLWNVSAKDQIFGSATLRDLNQDGIEDIIINGRSATLTAINGVNGQILWRFDKNTRYNNKKHKWLNFYNPQFIPDQNNDGFADILISNGGDVMAEPYNPKRPPGNLVIINALDGDLISMAPMPDGKEIYMSVAIAKNSAMGTWDIIFGTGGETIGGNLFVTTLTDVRNGDISNAIRLASSADKGFVAPPVWVDITGDGVLDIISNAVDGRLLAFDGKTYTPIWSAHMENTEAYASVAVGQFTGDSIPDFFICNAQGSWPNLDWSKQFMVNGQNGQLIIMDSLGYLQMSTPVAADLNADQYDEAILHVNYQEIKDGYRKSFHNLLVAFDFNHNELIWLSQGLPGHNISSTPWVGDLDSDGFLDMVYCHSTNAYHTYTFDGFQVNLLKTNIRIKKPIKWGAYMGSNFDGIFK